MNDPDSTDAGARRPGPTPQPSLPGRALELALMPLGAVLAAVRHVRLLPTIRRTSGIASRIDLPDEIAAHLCPGLALLDDGSGHYFHRLFRVRVAEPDSDATALIDALAADLHRAAPVEAVSFRKLRGRLGELNLGDEYRVRMPAPWDGPVRVVRREATSFRFATLRGHLEAGQIEFRARDVRGGLLFEIEAWSRPGDSPAALVYDRLGIGREVQLGMWVRFCVAVPGLAGGRRVGPVTADTRRAPWPP